MNKQERLAALKAQISELLTRKNQLLGQIYELEKEPEPLVIFDGWKPELFKDCFMPDTIAGKGACLLYDDGKNTALTFNKRDKSDAVADAFCVLMELRNQEGAGQVSILNGCHIVYFNEIEGFITVTYNKYGAGGFICPCFPSQELCERAVNNVGRERVERCLKLFAMVAL